MASNARYLILSAAQAASQGLSTRKGAAVVDASGPSVVFESNSVDRLGRFQSAKAEAESARERADMIRGEIERIEAEADKAEKKAETVQREEGTLFARGQAAKGLGAGAGAALGAVALGAIVAPGRSAVSGWMMMLLALALMWALHRRSRTAAAAMGAALGAMGASRAFG